jgi:predicted small integral membrane protein
LVSSICCTLMATNPTLCHLSKVQYNANKILRDMGISKLIFFLWRFGFIHVILNWFGN